jgi:hypothetical protein
VKTNRLQDSHDKEYINGDKYFQQVTSPEPRDLGSRWSAPAGAKSPKSTLLLPNIRTCHSQGFGVKMPESSPGTAMDWLGATVNPFSFPRLGRSGTLLEGP